LRAKKLEKLYNSSFKLKTGQIPDILKVGLLNPIFNNKGDKNNSTNYRGITVMPAILKIMETILRDAHSRTAVRVSRRIKSMHV
jgi:hypothetical protein